MNLLQIKYFNAVIKHLNFTTAAKSLFLTQPSLSRQIALLEKELGVKLFYRDNRKVRLTPAGIELYKEFEKINMQIDHVIKKVCHIGQGTCGNISIGCLEVFNADMFFPEIINKFSSTYPDVKISIERGGFKYLREKLQDDTLDIIFTISSDIENPKEFLIKNIHNRKGSIVISKINKLSRNKTLNFSDLSDEPFFMISQNESHGIAAKTMESVKFHGFKNIKQVDNIETILSNVDLGLGFTILDKSVGEHRKNQFKFFDLPKDEAVFSAVCVCKKENLNPSAHLFLNILP